MRTAVRATSVTCAFTTVHTGVFTVRVFTVTKGRGKRASEPRELTLLRLCDSGRFFVIEHVCLLLVVPEVHLSFLQGGTALRVFVSPLWATKNQLVC